MSNPKKENEHNATTPTIEQINALVENIKAFLEKIMGVKLSNEILCKKNGEPFWVIKKQNSNSTICIIYYPSSNNKLGFWCVHENLTPGNSSEYLELKQEINNLATKLGLETQDLNIKKIIK